MTLDDRDHLDPADRARGQRAVRHRAASGRTALRRWSPVVTSLPDTPLDPRALLHNLEHGAVVVWLDPDVGGPGHAEVRRPVARTSWARRASTTRSRGRRCSCRASRATSRRRLGVALRAWGVALDCEGWDLAVADAFVGLHYGTRGDAPEASLGPWPSGNGVLVGPVGQDEGITTV